MRLRFLRFMEGFFSWITCYFGDKADVIDTELNQRLREFMELDKNGCVTFEKNEPEFIACIESAIKMDLTLRKLSKTEKKRLKEFLQKNGKELLMVGKRRNKNS